MLNAIYWIWLSIFGIWNLHMLLELGVEFVLLTFVNIIWYLVNIVTLKVFFNMPAVVSRIFRALSQYLHYNKHAFQDKAYCFKAVVDGFDNISSIWYESCKRCAASLLQSQNSANCKKCNEEIDDPLPRYFFGDYFKWIFAPATWYLISYITSNVWW